MAAGKYRFIGKSYPRVDGVEKVTGAARFGADLHLPGMLYGRVLRSTVAHARIIGIDCSKALALPGVRAVMTGKDLPSIPPGTHLPHGEAIEIDMHHLSLLVMARDKVLFSGHPVAALAATSPEIADEALGLIDVQYEVLPVVVDPLEAMKADAPLLHESLHMRSLAGRASEPSNVAFHLEMGRGDVARGFAEADLVIERTYRTQMVHQGYLEPEAETAMVYPDGRMVVWANTQGTFNQRNQLAVILGLSASNIKVVPMEVGGGFGGKNNVRISPLCIVLSQKTGRPVRIILTREEVLRATGPGAPTVITVKLGAKRDGSITALQGRLVYDAGAFPGAPLATGALSGFAPYKVPNLRVDGFDVVTNKPRVAAYRAPGATQACLAVESTVDEMAEALGLDPIEVRLRNAPGEGDPMPNEMPFSRVGLRELLEQARRHPAWTAPVAGKNRGRGVAVGFWRGATNTSSCTLTMSVDGSLSLVVGSVDITGTQTGLRQICAEILQVPPEEIRVTTGDTDSVGHTDNSSGSRITYTMGTAVFRACQDLLEHLRERAALRLRVTPEMVEYAEKRFWARDIPDKQVPLQELALASIKGEGALVASGVASRMKFAPVFCLHIADVEVDPDTGKVTLLGSATFQDVGCVINPQLVEGQMQGAAAQGIGWALMEELSFDSKGVLRNPTLLDYRMPTALDVPVVQTGVIEVPASDGPLGVRGVGEAGIVPPAAAIANAIARAVGVRMRALPMSAEQVFWALRGR